MSAYRRTCFAFVCTVALLTACGAQPGGESNGSQPAPTTPANAAGQQGASDGASGGRLALIVAIADYKSGTGWDDLSSDRDLELLRPALEQQGFQVATLTDSDATREGIVNAFREQLVGRASAGDLAYFHYSGHGQQITDDDSDEIDGFDEALVPHDAPAEVGGPGADGSMHLRDDDLNGLLRELRRKVGPNGEVVVSIDACFSGTGTRGEAKVRGRAQPLGPRAETVPGETEIGGGLVEAAGTRGSGPVGEEGLAPMIALSASKHDELADEASDDEGFTIGSLTYGMLQTFPELARQETYRSFFAKVRGNMAKALVGNTPQAEGAIDRPLFQGEPVVQPPFFVVASRQEDGVIVPELNRDGSKVKLAGGAISGLTNGTKIDLYPAGVGPGQDGAEPLAAGTITKVDPLTAVAQLDFELTEDEALGAQAYVTAQSFGDLGIVARLEGAAETLRPGLEKAIENEPVKFLTLGEAGGDVVLRADGVELVVEAVADGRRLWPPVGWDGESGVDSAPVGVVFQHLKDFARNRFLRRMVLDSEGYRVEVEVDTCTLECDDFGDCSCESPGRVLEEAGNRLLPEGTGYRLAVRNRGSKEAFVQVLELMPDGQWDQLWPLRKETQEPVPPCGEPCTPFVPKDSATGKPVVWKIGPPYGENVLKVFAGREPIDFRWLLGPKTRGVPPNPLEQLFEGALGPKTRGSNRQATVPSDGGVATSEVVFEIVPSG